MDKLLVFLLTPVDCLKMQEFVHSTWRRHGGLRSPLCGEAVVAQLHIVLFMAKLCSETEIVLPVFLTHVHCGNYNNFLSQ